MHLRLKFRAIRENKHLLVFIDHEHSNSRKGVELLLLSTLVTPSNFLRKKLFKFTRSFWRPILAIPFHLRSSLLVRVEPKTPFSHLYLKIESIFLINTHSPQKSRTTWNCFRGPLCRSSQKCWKIRKNWFSSRIMTKIPRKKNKNVQRCPIATTRPKSRHSL